MSTTIDSHYRDIHQRMLDMSYHIFKTINGRVPSDDEKHTLNNLLIEWSRLNQMFSKSHSLHETKREQEQRFKELSIRY